MTDRRRTRVSDFSSEDVDAAIEGEIVEIISNRKVRAVLIRVPKTDDEWERLCQLAEEITRKK